MAAAAYKKEKGDVGRPVGSLKTTKEENKVLMKTFYKLRPPGHYVDSRIVHSALPRKLRQKIVRRTVIRRLADKGYKPEKKLSKSDPGERQKKKRVAWCKKKLSWTAQK